MVKEKVETFCKSYQSILDSKGMQIPIGGFVTENYYVYPFSQNHLLDFQHGKGTTSSLLNIGISVYRRLYGNALNSDPFPWDDPTCSEVDYVSNKAIKELGGQNAVAMIKEGEDHYFLSVVRNEWLNEYNARQITNLIVSKLEKRIKNQEALRMYG